MNIHMGMWVHIHVFIYLSRAHRLSHVCTHTTHKHSHITCVNSEHTSTSHAWTHAWTHTIHIHIPHTMHTNVFIIYAVPRHTPHMCIHNTWIHPCTHVCHMHMPWQNAHIPHMYCIHTNHTQKHFPLQHTCMDTHTHTCRERENEYVREPGVVCLCIGVYVCPCMYVRVGNVCVSEWFVCIW